MGDFSRWRKAMKNYRAVLMQQGRVQLDADWNEQQAINLHYLETLAKDVIGPCGAPPDEQGGGFKIGLTAYLGVSFVTDQLGWAVGDGATILTTADGGTTWHTQSPPAGVTARLNAVSFVDSTHGWAVGDDATILAFIEDDAGMRWEVQNLPVGVKAHLRGVHFVLVSGAYHGWAVGDSGTVLFYDGTKWTQQSSGVSNNLHAVHFFNSTLGWAVGDDGAVLVFDGTNWMSKPSGVTTHLRSVFFVNADDGWAVGDDGWILKSINGGKDWSSRQIGTKPNLRGVFFIDTGKGWAVGDDGTILVTFSGGDIWGNQLLETKPNLRGVFFLAANKGWAVGDGGAILLYSGSIPTWKDQNPPGNFTISPGRIYVDGILCELENEITYLNQPDFPGAPQLDLDAGIHLAYLDVWQREITALDDPLIREVALGGPDTAVRLQTVCQVKVLPVNPLGANFCLAATINPSGQIIAPSTVTTNATKMEQACGVVTDFVPATAAVPGTLAIGVKVFRIAPGTTLNNQNLIKPGANLCLNATLNGFDQIVLPSAVTSNLNNTTLAYTDKVKSFTPATESDVGSLVFEGIGFPIAPGTALDQQLIEIGKPLNLKATINPNGQVITPSVVIKPFIPLPLHTGDCGVVTDFKAPTNDPGSITIDGRNFRIAAQTEFDHPITIGANLCLVFYYDIPTREISGPPIGGPVIVTPNPNTIIQRCGVVTDFTASTATTPGSITINRQTFPIAPNTLLTGQDLIKPVSEVVSCDTQFPEWDSLIAPRNVKLNARTQPPSGEETPCQIPPSAGYQRLENQLYRAEIHQGGALGAATFVWSRDNASVVTTIIEVINGQVIKVHDVGPDSILGFASGQLVEITDDRIELNGEPGQLFKILDVNAAKNEITLDAAPPTIDINRHPKLRRWDSAGEMIVMAPPDNDGWIPLEGGIEVQFSDGDYRTGGYWLIPARTATGDIEWPPFQAGANPIPQPPLGIEHHYCRLALIQFDGQNLQVLSDCRHIFCPLPSCTDGGSEPGIRITNVSLIAGGDLPNDTRVAVDKLAQGLLIQCDGIVDAATLEGKPTCFVTLELPYRAVLLNGPGPIVGFLPLILAAAVTKPDTQTISWIPKPDTQNWLRQLFTTQQLTDPVLAHLTLKGNFIWGGADPQVYLDGEVFGFFEQPLSLRQSEELAITSAEVTTNTSVRFPSGDGQRGGDFEMWFWLVNQCPPITVNPMTLPDGRVGTAYSQTLMATGGAAPYTFVVTSGTLPAGLTLFAGGSLSGTPTQSGTFNFTITATDQNNCVGARAYTVMICQPPAITTQPTSQTVSPGAPVNFSVTATGTSLSYQWRKNGANIPGATSNSYTINATVPGDAGSYDVVVTGACGSAMSNTATLTVNPLPSPRIVVTPPSSFGDVCPGSLKDSVLKIGNSGESDLSVTSITPSSPEFIQLGTSLPLTIPPSGSHNVTIRFQPASFGNKSAIITISSNDPAKPSVTAPVTGVAPPPVISVDDKLEFGDVFRAASKPLTIRNIGNCALGVRIITLTGSEEFKVIGPVTFKIPPNSHNVVNIGFNPTDKNINVEQSGDIKITSDDPVTPVKTVKVTGTLRAS
jgi:photosystem II stability/assembly factor-like uncharacterized protein